MDILERFSKYIAFETTSSEESDTTPSTRCQLDLARYLVDELKKIGVEKVTLDRHGIVYGWITATAGYEDKKALGFISHMDTSPAASGKNVKINVIKDYDGKDVTLPGGVTLTVRDFPHLKSLAGRTLVTSDGTTLLGADDKAGIAEIVTAVEKVLSEKIPHGPLCIAFTPDEEVGRGADHFDVGLFGADFAYTVDGGPENELACETFNAASAHIKIHGVSVHPGDAKDVMVNAGLVACELAAMLPPSETPRYTQGYEGFYHLDAICGDVSQASMSYIIRDHDRNIFENRKNTVREVVNALNEKYGQGTVELTIEDSYYNMKEIVDHHPHLMENAKAVMEELGMTPDVIPVRGGTDGSRLSYMGLPCPNLGTGGYAYHGPMEHITREGMELASAVVVGLIKKYAL
ncbi:tripeptide aminopeptidase [Catenibacillus scindens]|uniref:Peptidase T n=1 Tax=Catenibacillus scindens TaxID=673271 RepID=A0A7W8H972_9FIRM|nr:peptidase T [Catenibacillus scindens]MBB5264224.1 tripeptide aminopeptidase [Catenibacillus scindens]